jgi:ABC-2 type transport system ATP-binding protein
MLDVVHLTKRYNSIPAVEDVSFRIRRGEILGYLGPNGSGKSTTVKMLTGLIEPTSGQILFDGVRVVHGGNPAFLQEIGYVPEEPYLYTQLTGPEYLRLVGRLHGISRRPLEKKIDGFMELFSLKDARHELLLNYSKGMRQKILLSAALLHNPQVLILDEPFSGLDVGAALLLRNLLKALAREGKAILYSSHVLEVVEKVCSEVVILYKGRIVAYDTVEHLRTLQAQPSLESVFSQLAVPEDTLAVAEQVIAVMNAG